MPAKAGHGLPGIVTDKEMEKLVLALARSGKPFSEEDALKVLTWAAEIRIGTAMLSLALEGKKALSIRENGEVVMGENAHENG